jgi:hypothetical protein
VAQRSRDEERLKERLNEGLEETFQPSDPVSVRVTA